MVVSVFWIFLNFLEEESRPASGVLRLLVLFSEEDLYSGHKVIEVLGCCLGILLWPGP